MSLDHFTTEELEQEIARRGALGCKFKANTYVNPKRSTPPWLDSLNSYRVVSTKNEYIRVICDDGIVRGIHQDDFYPTFRGDEEEFGGPDESFY